jgi:hypothetical protein
VPTLRLASVDARAFPRDRAALAAALASVEPHVAVVHNAPHLGRWRTLSSTVARNAGLVVVGGGRPAGANLLLSSLAVDFGSTADVPFRRDPFRPAGAVVAQLRWHGARFVVAGVSLGATSATADAAVVRSALSDVAGVPRVISVVGDPAVLADLGRVVAGRLVVDPALSVGDIETGDIETGDIGTGNVETGNVVVVDLGVPDA